MANTTIAKPEDALIADDRVLEAELSKAVRQALLKHKRAGHPIPVWEDGKVVWIPAEDIEVVDPPGVDCSTI